MIIIIKILQDIVIVIDALGQPFVVINRLGLIVASILGMESYGLMVCMKVGEASQCGALQFGVQIPPVSQKWPKHLHMSQSGEDMQWCRAWTWSSICHAALLALCIVEITPELKIFVK